ncbi:DUF1800 domain-containing protein [Nocardioides perillae]|uniref:Uncharacterized protein (DUF1800 family) n=1 Tax=Nocardioides perillae TaxID=1119534 RepID=A0A7Y9RV79_9ACTN|nr:DUF1800 domain-containing protein [Nocardioides perillae]NYG55966.1 uncharacterized protein (DUF1800 family) [Nocardioides perillae]
MATAPRATPFSRHLANRFGYGWTPALQRQVDRAGGPARWFEQQLTGVGVSDAFHDTSRGWWPSLTLSGPQIWARHQAGVQEYWRATSDYQRWVLARRIHSERQVLEAMTDFWENHLHVPAVGEAQAMYRASYGAAIRAHALGSFEDLLHAAITHPAMGCYLNNAVSTAKAPNEDLGRELLEVHTLGRGNHTEDDVKASARILTGWRVALWRDWTHGYDPASHWVGPVRVAGFEHPNADPDGRAVTRAYLRHLAHHPATARRIARRLALRFVSDDPSAALVEHLAQTYLQHGTEVKPVLRALVAHPEFRRSAGRKVRTPEEDVVATYRVLGVRLARPTDDESAANALLWQTGNIGLQPFAWPRPDGRPDVAEAWSSTARVLASFDVHVALAGGWWPREQVSHRPARSWLPARRVRFAGLVDHLSRSLLGRPASPTLQRACREVVGVGAREVVDASHGVVRWDMWRLLTTVLDSPAHMSR